ncbi:anhydro-N-acetylmuramic acid kinase [Herbaspirillum hiltneri N3]|uniref:Anhydro-N-acetylmuramic acid kinase n=1 Tax=Herbaspirillum hiltneri N3 TaxID=1262470 RepID=A0ABM5UW23_9BURK|nr:anhydro-N-acetylmuramic acid kinase [Herbaspirillum hiltneri]AKZ61408.1 anhydro-N-acetylmuramic acid kinase [Herbaspirillum hiltneri N3]
MPAELSSPQRSASSSLYIGLMSGTSLDGVDGVLASLPDDGQPMATLATAYVPFPQDLRAALMALQSNGENELQREALAANQLANHYAQCVAQLLEKSAIPAAYIRAVGVHGQTIRHRPELGYTRQTNNPSLLAELCGIDVIADFRSRDVAAGGQGAPLVPAFHQAVFGSDSEMRVAVNIGGISNISILPAGRQAATSGFDTGPGNVLMDAWIARHQGQSYDADGAWGASGKVDAALLAALRSDAYFALPPPKSTGRDLFHVEWLEQRLQGFSQLPPADVQATLTAFTATTIADAIVAHAPATAALYVCGGGAYNGYLLEQLAQALQASAGRTVPVMSTEVLGVAPNHVEALAFAWLAQRFCLRLPGNLPAVTGARGLRVLGGLYPAQ